MANLFAHEQHEWAMTGNNRTQVPFTASTSDDIFTPTSGRHISSIPSDNNPAYNHNFCTPTAQSSQFPNHFVHERPPHFPSPPSLPQHNNPSHFPRIHSSASNDTFRQRQTQQVPNLPHFPPVFVPQQPPLYYTHPIFNSIPPVYPPYNPPYPPQVIPPQQPTQDPIQYVYLPAPPAPLPPVSPVRATAESDLAEF